MDRNDYTATNRLAWNEAAPIHKKLKFDQLIERFCQPGYSCLDAIETAQFHEIGLANTAVAQIGCNNGRELLSVKNLSGLTKNETNYLGLIPYNLFFPCFFFFSFELFLEFSFATFLAA